MMIQPFFSVVIPVYNSEYFIKDCVESVLKQDFKNFELILINDGSIDNSGKICDDYALKDERIRIIHQRNTGVSAARNRGIEVSSGEYVTFIDSDDYVETEYLSKFHQLFEEYDYDLGISGVCMNYDGFQINKRYFVENVECKNFTEIAFVIPELENKMLLSGPYVKAFKNKIIKENNIFFDGNFSFGEDAIFNLTYLLHVNSLATTNYVGYNYMQRDNDSLVNKKYSFEVTVNFAETITACRTAVAKKFNIKSFIYKKLIEKEFTLYTLNALFSNYDRKYKKDKKFRIAAWNKFLGHLFLSTLPDTLYYRLIKIVILTKNTLIIDFFFSRYFLIKAKNN